MRAAWASITGLMLLSAVLAGAAQAASFSREVRLGAADGFPTVVFRFVAAPGETNDMAISTIPPDGRVLVSDSLPIDVRPPCTARPSPLPTQFQAECPFPPVTGVVQMFMFLRDGDDQGSAGPGYVPVEIRGNRGNDAITGGSVLRGGTGNDQLAVSTYPALIVGGPGNDEVVGGEGADVINPGPGRDIVFKRDDPPSQQSDVIDARGDLTDQVLCAPLVGRDRILLDKFDFSTGCRGLDRPRPGMAVPLSVRPDVDGRGVRVTVGCPSDGPFVCRGRLAVLSSRGRLGRHNFELLRSIGYLDVLVSPKLSQRRLRSLGSVGVRLRSRDAAGRLRTLRVRLPVSEHR